MMDTQYDNVYMLGISGMGMCPLAIYLSEMGLNVYGADDCMRPDVSQILRDSGVKIEDGELPDSCECIVYSSAIDCDHPLYQQALKRGLPLFRRGEFLSRMLSGKRIIGIVGSHGKTTTCGYLIQLLRKNDFKFSYLLGGLFHEESSMPGHYDEGSECVVLEIDESDGTIDGFAPDITLALNYDWDHPSKYLEESQLKDTFQQLFNRTKHTVWIPEGCEVLRGLTEETDAQVSYFKTGRELVELPNPSVFNSHNASAALAVGERLLGGVQKDVFKGYAGIKRRMELLVDNESVLAYMDYAHHPTEVRALIEYFRSEFGGAIHGIFQPHRYSRTRMYAKEFAEALDLCEEVTLLPVYAASEAYDEQGRVECIAAHMESNCRVLPFSYEALQEYLPQSEEEERKLILFIGAGDIEHLALEYKKQLQGGDWWRVLAEGVSPETKLTEMEPLAKKTTLRVGGCARYYGEPANVDDLKKMVGAARASGYPAFILGRGSNLIIPDELFDGLVVRFNHNNWRRIEQLDSRRLYVSAGARLKEICGFACKQGLAGFEFLEGIPGALGGSLRMNAGAMGGWLYDVVESIERLTYDGRIEVLSKDELTLGYRHCSDLKNSIAIGAILKAPSLEEESVIREKINQFAKVRKASQPREPSAGCIFKNPGQQFAGQLIQEVGLMGSRVGNAEVSSTHANFIINRGGATYDDVVSLVAHIRERVQLVTGVELEPEVLLLGKTWKEVLAAHECTV